MKTILLLLIAALLLLPGKTKGQDKGKVRIRVYKGFQVVLRDTSFIARHDTILLLSYEEAKKIKIKENPYDKSKNFYDSLGKKASDSKVAGDILDLVVTTKGRKERLVSSVVKSEDAFRRYAGYKIGTISFHSVDMLEGSVIDTLQKATTKFGKFVNTVHKDTRAHIIKKNIFFESGDKVDPYKLADNERILRQLNYLRDARIYLVPGKVPGVVDVVVVTQDVSSVGVSGDWSSLDKFRFDVYDINILGFAKQLKVSYFYNGLPGARNGYELTLTDRNLFQSFIQGEIQYTDNYNRNRIMVSLGKDFFAAHVKYAGGLEVYRTNETFFFEDYDTLETPYTENAVDFWIGRSFQFQERMNLIFASRIDVSKFILRPFISSDSNTFFYDRTFVLNSVSLIKRNFLKSMRIRGFGKTEDIPVGASVSLLFGQEYAEFTDRSYLEFKGMFGRYFPSLGYVNLNLAIGSFYKARSPEDGLISLTSTYFSDLVKFRKTQVRQFIFFTYMRGFHRVLDKTISLSGKWEDNNELPPMGDQLMTLGFETVYFMPWYAYGFQCALFHRVDVNLLSDKTTSDRTLILPTVRAGMRVLNDNLVLPGFSIEVGYFGRSREFDPAWEIKFSTTLPDLFSTTQIFKPQVFGFK